ncbi:unnamed protein product, partial [Symbiodinium microadriaticum]
ATPSMFAFGWLHWLRRCLAMMQRIPMFRAFSSSACCRLGMGPRRLQAQIQARRAVWTMLSLALLPVTPWAAKRQAPPCERPRASVMAWHGRWCSDPPGGGALP